MLKLQFQFPFMLLIIPFLFYVFWLKKKAPATLKTNTNHNHLSNLNSFRYFDFQKHLRFFSLLFLLIATAGPRVGKGESKVKQEGLDIVLVLDTSGSMQALDFEIDGQRQDRLTVIKKVVSEFIAKRVNDRIGLVVFGTQAFTQAPLTLDHDILENFLDHVQIGMAGKATAIGDALATASKRLADIPAKSKLIILLTDGSNTGGQIDPLQAARAASSLGIKIYTIGVGQNEPVPFPVQGIFGETVQYQKVEMDEESLKKIADETGGAAFLASDTKALRKVYATIDQLEKTKVESKKYHEFEEKMSWFAWPALLLFVLEGLWTLSRRQKIP